MKASHQNRWVPIITGKGKTEIEVQSGQFIFGRKTAAKELLMTESTIRNRIEKLKLIGNISLKPDTHYTIISICNWERYQSNEKPKGQAKDRQRTTKGQPKDTDKNVENVNNVNNEKKEEYGTFKNVLLTSEEYKKLSDQFNGTLNDRINTLSEGIESKGYKYKSHYATILSWDRLDKKRQSGDKPKKKDTHNGFAERDYQEGTTRTEDIPEFLR